MMTSSSGSGTPAANTWPSQRTWHLSMDQQIVQPGSSYGKVGLPLKSNSSTGLLTWIDAGRQIDWQGEDYNTTPGVCFVTKRPRRFTTCSWNVPSQGRSGMRLSWLRMTYQPPSDEATLLDWWHAARQSTPKPLHKGLASTTLLVPWMIWKHRNESVFERAHPSVTDLSNKIREEAASWVKAGAKGLRDAIPTTWDVH